MLENSHRLLTDATIGDVVEDIINEKIGDIDISNLPIGFPPVNVQPDDDNLQSFLITVDAMLGDQVSWDNILHKPDFKTVSTSGSYNDLTDKPSIPSVEGLATQEALASGLDGKQDTLTPGDNIRIEGNVISAVCGGGGEVVVVDNLESESSEDALSANQGRVLRELIEGIEATGVPGPEGPQGSDGQSAYELAVSEGFEGTEEAWLASLVGPQGETGHGVPAGGTAGQILVKVDSADYNTHWIDNPLDVPDALTVAEIRTWGNPDANLLYKKGLFVASDGTTATTPSFFLRLREVFNAYYANAVGTSTFTDFTVEAQVNRKSVTWIFTKFNGSDSYTMEFTETGKTSKITCHGQPVLVDLSKLGTFTYNNTTYSDNESDADALSVDLSTTFEAVVYCSVT